MEVIENDATLASAPCDQVESKALPDHLNDHCYSKVRSSSSPSLRILHIAIKLWYVSNSMLFFSSHFVMPTAIIIIFIVFIALIVL